MRRLAVFAVLLVFVSSIAAPVTAAPRPGATIRILPRTQGSAPIVGDLVQLEPSRLVYQTEDGRHVALVPAEALLVEERGRGRSHTLLGTVLGLGIGIGTTAILLGDEAAGGSGIEALGLVVVLAGGTVGALVGAVTGTFVRSERWQVVDGWDDRDASSDVSPLDRSGERIRPGTRVRITPGAPNVATVAATVVRVEPQAVVARVDDGDVRTFTEPEILLIEQRPARRELGGAILGGLLGLAGGIAVVSGRDDNATSETIAVAAAAGAGAATGAMLARGGSRRWEVVHGWDRRVADAAPIPRVGLQLAWRW